MRKRHSGIFSNYNNVLALLMLAAAIFSLGLTRYKNRTDFSSRTDSALVNSTETVELETIEVVIPRSLLSFCGDTAEEQAEGFFDIASNTNRFEDVIANPDGSVSYICTQAQIESELEWDLSFFQDRFDIANSNWVDYLTVSQDFTEIEIGVSDYQTINNVFSITPLLNICGYIQIFSHPENPEWHIDLTIVNTNTGIVGCECTIPDEVMYLDCQQFFIDTEDPDAFSPDEHVNNVIITTGDLSAAPTVPTIDISTYETWVPDEDLTEILLPVSLINVAGTRASQMISSFYDPNTSTPYSAEGVLSNEDESLSFYCTQAEIEETLDNLESYIQDRVSSANGNLVDSIEISDDYSEITIEVSDVQSFEDMFSLHDVWVYCAAQQLFSHPDDPEWHLHLIIVNSQTGSIGYECTLPDEDLNINSVDIFENAD